MSVVAPLPEASDNSPPPVSNQEYALLDHAVRLERNLNGRLALHIHLSQLSAQNRREQQSETAFTQFKERTAGLEGKLYRTIAGDLIYVGDESRSEALQSAVERLAQMFPDDPLTSPTDDETESGFCTWFALERDYPQFVALARHLFDISQQGRQQDYSDLPNPLSGIALTPTQLGQLEAALATADLSAVMRNQPVCAVTPDAAPEIVFHEMYVSIDELGRTLLPGVAIGADPWLFQRLTRTLDTRMLRQVARDHARSFRAVSLNLNVATVLSADFRRFEQALGAGARGRLIIEFQHIDIFSDMAAYLFAREYLRELGFKVCLDGLNHLTLPLVDREQLGIDLLKMQCSDDLMSGMSQDAIVALEKSVRSAGVARIIMCRCESQTALQIGYNMGISLFQGRYIDSLLAAQHAQ